MTSGVAELIVDHTASVVYTSMSSSINTAIMYSIKKFVILHPYLPIIATSSQGPFSPVPKGTVVERFDCNKN